jgi:hypothetical protein
MAGRGGHGRKITNRSMERMGRINSSEAEAPEGVVIILLNRQ